MSYGAPKYVPEKPCKNGHRLRWANTGHCIQCQKDRTRKCDTRYKDNPAYKERQRRRTREYSRRTKGIPAAGRPMPEVCESCGTNPAKSTGRFKFLCLDHDHTTGKFRGWLCNRCNRGLGMVGDTIESVERLLVYLRRAYVA